MTDRERSRDPEAPGRRRRPDRIGDLLPEAARALGLERELRLARAVTTWDALIAERVPPAAGACRLVRLDDDAIVVAADEPIVGAEGESLCPWFAAECSVFNRIDDLMTIDVGGVPR